MILFSEHTLYTRINLFVVLNIYTIHYLSLEEEGGIVDVGRTGTVGLTAGLEPTREPKQHGNEKGFALELERRVTSYLGGVASE